MRINPIISVIVPCYNQAQFLPDALFSVYSQTFPSWECIIINDGSTDSTEIVAIEWVNKDARYKYYKKNNGGLSSARNFGLNKISGSFIQFLDADDVLDKNKFQLQTSKMINATDYSLCYCDYFPSTEHNLYKEYPSRYISPRFKTNNYLYELISDWEKEISIPCHCFLFRSELFKSNNILFDESLPNHEDWECWMNVVALKPVVYYIDKKLVTYRIRANAMCNDKKAMNQGFIRAIIKQKAKFEETSQEYSLLSKKFNLLNYGYGSGIKIIDILFGYIIKTKQTLKSKLRRLIMSLYHVI